MTTDLSTFMTTGEGTLPDAQPTDRSTDQGAAEPADLDPMAGFWSPMQEAQSAEAEPEEGTEPEATQFTPDPSLPIPVDLQEWLASGKGDIDAFYAQKYATQQPQQVQQAQPEVKQPEQTNLVQQIDSRIQEVSDLLKKNYRIDLSRLSDEEADAVIEDRNKMVAELGRLGARRESVQAEQNQSLAKTVTSSYSAKLEETLMATLGFKPTPAITKKVSDFLEPIVAASQDVAWLQDPMVQEIVIKAKLFDALIESRGGVRRGERQQVNAGQRVAGGQAPARTAVSSYEQLDGRSQLEFLKTGTINPGGKK